MALLEVLFRADRRQPCHFRQAGVILLERGVVLRARIDQRALGIQYFEVGKPPRRSKAAKRARKSLRSSDLSAEPPRR